MLKTFLSFGNPVPEPL